MKLYPVSRTGWPVVKRIATGVLLAALLGANLRAALSEPTPGATTNVLAQIAALQAEARSLSASHKKVASSLLDALREYRGFAPRPYAPKLRAAQKALANGNLLVDIRGRVSQELLKHIKLQGGTVVSSYPQYRSIRAEIPVGALELIADHLDVESIAPAEVPLTNIGTATSEGDVAHQANTVRTNFGITGAGVKVGVISDSSLGLNISQANGDLGPVTILPGQSGVGGSPDTGEGTAMLEIVHDLAPGAQLYFAAGNGGPAAMAANIIALADAGCDIIIDDISYSNESPFQENDVINSAVKTVSDRGVLYFSSAANSGNLTHGTSGTWRGDFSDGGFSAGLGQLHNWGGSNFNAITNQGNRVVLFWSEPLGGASSDYNLYITDSAGNILRRSETVQNGSQNPFESVSSSTNSGEYVVVARLSGVSRYLYVDTSRGRLAIGTSGNTRGHNASGAPNAFSVAASSAKLRTTAFVGGSVNPVEAFSSDGNPRVFFDFNGNAITPGNFTSTGGLILQKPEITAADGVICSTTFTTNSGFRPFFGTSAAAPHAGAIAALLKSYKPSLTATQIRDALMNTALDIEAPGFDRDSGAGIIMADAALNSVAPTVAATFSPLTNNATVLDLSQIGGVVSEPVTVKFRIQEYNVGGTDRYWDGSGWITDGSSPSVLLEATVTGNNWAPAAGVNLPTRAQLRYGAFFLRTFPHNGALNTYFNEILVHRSAPDTTVPNLTLDSISDGQVFTNRVLPGIFGTASDPETGIANVDVFLLRATNPGFSYWTGSAWSSTPTTLHANYNSGAGTWQLLGSLPSGSILSNGVYQVQVSAGNNEAPQGTRGITISFTVDYHPVFVWTAGSFFDSVSGNENHNWDNPANWDVGEVPSSDALVYVLTGTPNANSMGSMTLYGLIISNNASVTAPGILIQKKLNFYSGTLNAGTVNISSNAVFEWSGGTLAGSYGILNGGSLVVTNSADKIFNSAFITNSGSILWYGAGILNANATSVIHNNGLFEARTDSLFYNYTGGNPSPLFNNLGTFRKTSTTNQTVFRTDNGGWVFNNSGLVDVQTGVLSLQSPTFLNNGGTFSGVGLTRVDASTTTMAGGSTISNGATFELATGTLTGTGTFNGPGTFAWSGGTIAGNNTAGAGGNFLIKGNSDKTLSGTFSNAGTGTWTGLGHVNCPAGSTFNNSGTFIAQNDSLFFNTTGGNPQPLFNNSGTFVKAVGTGTTDFPTSNNGVLMNNSGLVHAINGIIAFGGGGTNNNGTFTADAGSRIDFTGGIHYLVTGVNVTGTGITRLASGTVHLGGGTNTIVFGGTFEVAGGTLDGTGGIAGPGSFNWTGGNIAGTLHCLASLNLNLSGNIDKSLTGGTINNAGTVTWTGTGFFNAQAGSTFNNTGSFTAQNDAAFFNNTGGLPQPVFNNTGTFRKTTAGGLTTFRPDNGGWNFINSGTVDIQSGVLSLQSPASINNGGTFSGAGQTRVDASTTTVTGNSTIAAGGIFQLAVGTLNGTGTFSGPGTFNWTGGTLSGTNGVAANGNLLISGNSDKALTGRFSNAGAGIWTGLGNINCPSGAIFNNSGTFTAQNNALFFNTTGGNPQPVFNNSGTFSKSVGTGTTDFPVSNNGVGFNNTGTMNVQTGVIALGGGGTNNNANYTAAAGTRIDFSAGSHYLNGDLSFNGAGVTRVAGGTVIVGGGTHTINAGGTFEVAGGTVQGSGSFQGAGGLAWTGGTIKAQLNMLSGSTLNLSGAADKTLGNGGIINNFATTTWSGTGLFQGDFGTTFNNLGTFTIQNNSAFYNTTGGSPNPVFNNIGTLRKSVATGTTLFQAVNASWFLTNSGLVDIQSGILSVQAQASFNAGSTFAGAGSTRIESGGSYLNGLSTVSAGGTFELAGGSLVGAGTLNGPGNTIWSGGSLTGTLTIGANGNLLLNGNAGRTLIGTLNTSGTTTWTGAGNLLFQSGSSYNNSGLLLVQNDAQFFNTTGGAPTPIFNNSGTFRKTIATGNSTINLANGGVAVTNSGTIDLQSGTLDIQSSYFPTAASQYKVNLGGLTVGTQFGRETFSQPVTLTGALVVSLANGFIPTNGNSFAITTYPSRSGEFNASQFPLLPDGLVWQVDYGATVTTLKVVQQTVISNAAKLGNGHFQFNLTGPNATSAIIQGSTNLVDWVGLRTNAPFNGSYLFDDAQAATYTNRFYRVLILP